MTDAAALQMLQVIAQNIGNLNLGTYAPLASPTFTGTVTAPTLVVTGTITPSQTGGIVGTNTNNNANAGSVGEYISSSASSVSLTSTVAANVTSISLTAGDWDVSGDVAVVSAAGTIIANATGGINTTSATIPSFTQGSVFQLPYTAPASATVASPCGTIRISVSTTTTVYLVVNATFSVSTCTTSGFIGARRVR
jgi:hypothetical protein